jgi:hypothetical protein
MDNDIPTPQQITEERERLLEVHGGREGRLAYMILHLQRISSRLTSPSTSVTQLSTFALIRP